MNRDAVHRLVYVLELMFLGVPSVVVGGFAAVLGVVFGIAVMSGAGFPGVLIFAWGFAGLCGLVGLMILSVIFLAEGVDELRKARACWWALTGLGVVAACPMALALFGDASGGSLGGYTFLCGPALLLPAAHLIWLGFGVRSPMLAASTSNAG